MADEQKKWGTTELEGNASITVFPFFTVMHYEVILRHEDGISEDIEMTPDEADRIADMLRAAAQHARDLKKKEDGGG